MPSCNNCNHSNPDNAKFCNHCGSALANACANCGAENPAEAKFCNQCGNAFANKGGAVTTGGSSSYTPAHLADKILKSRSSIEGERKQVTVMFVDLQRSMDLSNEVGAERWHEILDEFFTILNEQVHAFEGTVNQYTGDGIMALFGAPISHEDHAARACRSALAMQRALAEFSQKLRLSDAINFATRIGLNSGEVIVGRIGDDLRMDYTAQGHTVGLAARMEALAESGEIYLTAYTAKLVEGYFKLNNLGASNIKGVTEPLDIYSLSGHGNVKNRLDLSRARGLSQFVGRDDELHSLKDILDFNTGTGSFITIEGDAGIGKSRLCYELSEQAQQRQVDVFTASCVPYHNAAPFHPVKELMSAYFLISEMDAPNVARQKVAGALTLVGMGEADTLQTVFEFLDIADPTKPGINLPAETRLQRLLQMYMRYNEVAPDRQSLVIIDDLQWADTGSLEFLQAMLLEADTKPVAVVFNYRPHAIPDWFQRAHQHLSLKPLDKAAISQLTTMLIGEDSSSLALREQITERASGNPYFVEEAVQSLLEDGTLSGENGFLSVSKPVADIAIPNTIQALIAARIDRLNDDVKTTLQTAAIIGSQFERELLQQTLQLGDEVLSEQLEHLQTNGFAQAVQIDDECDIQNPCHWEFRHPLIQEVAYHSQLKTARQKTHAQLAAILEPVVEKQTTHNELILQLAHHWERAKNWDKAANWVVKATNYQAGKDLVDALRRYRRAIEVLDASPVSEAVLYARVAARAGILRVATFYVIPADEIEQHWQQAKDIIAISGDQSALAELQVSYGLAQLQYADADDAVAHTTDALNAVRNSANSTELESRFRISLLITFFSAGRLTEGLQLLVADADEQWTDGEVNESNFYSRGFHALVVSYTGKLDKAYHDIKSVIHIAEKRKVPVSWFYANLVEYCNLSGNGDEALTAAKAGIQRAEDYGSPFFLSNAYRQLGLAHCINRNWDEAIEACEHVLPICEYGQPGYQFRAILLAVTSRAYLGKGDLDKALEFGNRAITLAQKNNTRLSECIARLTMLSILRKRNNQDDDVVKSHLQQIENLITRTGAEVFTPFLLEEKARLLWHQGNQAGGADMLNAAYEGFKNMGASGHAQRLAKAAK